MRQLPPIRQPNHANDHAVADDRRAEIRGLFSPETATKKLRNLFGFRAQFEELPESKHYFRDFSPRRKNQGAVEGAKSALYL